MNNDRPGSKLKLALDKLNLLPAMPVIAQKLLALSLDTEEGERQMLRLIEQDLQLYARIIGLANSPGMGVGRKINSIRDAAMLLGMKRLKTVALGIATMSKMLSLPPGKNFDPHDLWTHGMTIAMVMNLIAHEMPARIRPDDSQIFLAGLLHDIGLMALHHLDPEASDELHRQLRLQPKCPIAELELELLGVTHGYIGAKLVRHWHLPDDIVEVVELHHAPNLSLMYLVNPLVRLANIAEKLLPDFGVVEHSFEPIDDSEWAELCIDPKRAGELFELANELAMQLLQLPEEYGATEPVVSEVQLPVESAVTRLPLIAAPIPPPVTPPVPPAASSGGFAPFSFLFGWIARLFR